jgi:hypothetical protein
MREALSNEQLEPLILTIRDQRVMLDADPGVRLWRQHKGV